MAWFNPYGLIFVLILLIPNVVFAVKCKDGFENKVQNKALLTAEQIGRFGCFLFMVINIPKTSIGFASDTAFVVYLISDAALVLIYCLVWIFCFRKSSVFRALALSILPSVLFLSSGILSRSILLTLSAVLFAPCHIGISYKNAV